MNRKQKLILSLIYAYYIINSLLSYKPNYYSISNIIEFSLIIFRGDEKNLKIIYYKTLLDYLLKINIYFKCFLCNQKFKNIYLKDNFEKCLICYDNKKKLELECNNINPHHCCINCFDSWIKHKYLLELNNCNYIFGWYFRKHIIYYNFINKKKEYHYNCLIWYDLPKNNYLIKRFILGHYYYIFKRKYTKNGCRSKKIYTRYYQPTTVENILISLDYIKFYDDKINFDIYYNFNKNRIEYDSDIISIRN